jgi:hypothetical protein
MTFSLRIKSHFWRKDSNSLFDYEASDISTSIMPIQKPCILIQEGNYIMKQTKTLLGRSLNYLCTLSYHNEVKGEYKFKIEEDYYQPQEGALVSDNWVILKHTYSYKELGYKLRDGIHIKLGKIVFKVKEVSVGQKGGSGLESKRPRIDRNVTNNENANNNQIEDVVSDIENISQTANRHHISSNQNVPTYSNISNLNIQDQSNDYILNHHQSLNKTSLIKIKSRAKTPDKQLKKTFNYTQTNTNSLICRICLGDESEDTLLSVCKCTGSVKYIHLTCLRKWLNSKITTKSYNHLTVYSYKNLNCELCKAALTDTIIVKNKKINLLDFNVASDGSIKSREWTNYIALECIREKSQLNEKKTIYIIYLKEKDSLKVGRSTDSDVRMTDISVSRNHALLHIHEGSIYLKDRNSKFGTHVNFPIAQEIILLPEKPLAIQCGKHFLIFELYKSLMSYLCCIKLNHNYSYLLDYNEVFSQIYDSEVNNNQLDETSKPSELIEAYLPAEEIINHNEEENLDSAQSESLNQSEMPNSIKEEMINPNGANECKDIITYTNPSDLGNFSKNYSNNYSNNFSNNLSRNFIVSEQQDEFNDSSNKLFINNKFTKNFKANYNLKESKTVKVKNGTTDRIDENNRYSLGKFDSIRKVMSDRSSEVKYSDLIRDHINKFQENGEVKVITDEKDIDPFPSNTLIKVEDIDNKEEDSPSPRFSERV